MDLALDTKSSYEKQIYSIGNKIIFAADIDHQSASILIKHLYELEECMLKDTKELSGLYKEKSSDYTNIVIQAKPILLELTTGGGNVMAAFSIINCMNNLKVDVHTIINGHVASAGTLISLAGKKRFIYKHSYVLIHEVRTNMWGKLTFLEDQYNNTQRMMNDIIDYYKKYLKMEDSELTAILQRDKHMSATDCLKINMIDEILL